ncbi:MAG: ubiquinol-cytochrome C chaperone family protein [Caulobacteraceae bacterium]
MILDRLSSRKSDSGAARRLHAWAVARARQPILYAEMGVPDTVEGRFEILTLHVILLLDRLRHEAGDAIRARQELFDVYLRDLDGALREMSVGDLAVGRRMRNLGEVFYGRAKAYDEAFADLPDQRKLAGVVARTVLHEVENPDPRPLANYVAQVRESLGRTKMDSLHP